MLIASLGRTLLIVLPALALSACTGENAQTGSAQDEAAAVARGERYSGSGPNERIGEAKDRAAAADQKVRDTAAESLRAQGQNIRRQADVDAAVFDEKSRAIREQAAKQSEALTDPAPVHKK